MTEPLQHLERSALGAIPDDALAFLNTLGRPTAIHVRGRDRTRTRVVTTLLHGNEPSGFRAIHAWLRSGATPAVDALLIVANVEAALADPVFGRRMLPGRRDLNRCFAAPRDDPDGALAAAIAAAVRECSPEAAIDLHNNTGHNPPYGVGLASDLHTLQLVSLFADRFVQSHLELGALMEAITDLTSATIEVGRTGDPVADAVARSGLGRYLERNVVLDSGGAPLVQVLHMPMRAELHVGVRLAIGASPRPGCDLTLYDDLDRHNFERVAPGTAIGWSTSSELPVSLRDADGVDHAPAYFDLADGELRVRREIVPIMITTDPEIAALDCLFYVVRERDAG